MRSLFLESLTSGYEMCVVWMVCQRLDAYLTSSQLKYIFSQFAHMMPTLFEGVHNDRVPH